jgi:tetratricopeptide (TPR) repeat protein
MAQEGVTPHPSDPGSTPQDITDLVEAVGRHPRALVLLAHEVARRGVRATTATVREFMTAFHARYLDDREQSLYASVELSLRRLPPEVRAQLQPLAVFQGGVNIVVWKLMTGAETETIRNIAAAVIGVGLGTYMDYGHLRLDPALPPYLLRELNQADQEHLRTRWAERMEQQIVFLGEQRFQDPTLATQLTLLELPNILAVLAWFQETALPEKAVAVATRVEALLAPLGRPHALAQATAVRAQADQALAEWSHARFSAESQNINRLRERGDLHAAYTAAQRLLERCLADGDAAYQGAAYDIAVAYYHLGSTLASLGAAEAALHPLTEAQQRSQVLVEAGNAGASYVAAVAIAERGNCLADLGRLDEAVAAYEDAIERFEQGDDRRNIAAVKGQLGTVLMVQQRDEEALAAYQEALKLFDAFGEPVSVAVAWHQIGRVYRRAQKFEQAEQAYRESLAITVQQQDRSGEADTLHELGHLYNVMGRLEEAVTFSRQAAERYITLQNLISEGGARQGLAVSLITLLRYNEARQELHRVFVCNSQFGHAAEPWKTWALLHNLEEATGNTPAAADAWQQAVQSYLAYRRDGGGNHAPSAQLCSQIAYTIRHGDTTEAIQFLARAAAAADTPARLKIMLPKLHAILHGDRAPALAADPALNYDDAAELLLLLETLEAEDMESKE